MLISFHGFQVLAMSVKPNDVTGSLNIGLESGIDVWNIREFVEAR